MLGIMHYTSEIVDKLPTTCWAEAMNGLVDHPQAGQVAPRPGLCWRFEDTTEICNTSWLNNLFKQMLRFSTRFVLSNVSC